MVFAAEQNGIATTIYYAQLRDQLKEAHVEEGGIAIGDLIGQCGEGDVRTAIGQVMSKHGWFKTTEKGQALARHLEEGGLPRPIKDQIVAFGQKLKGRFGL